MVRGFGKEVRTLLRANGCRFIGSGKVDHEVWFSPIANRNIIVDGRCEQKHTANGVLKDAGIKERL
jgi:hypothetical protein